MSPAAKYIAPTEYQRLIGERINLLKHIHRVNSENFPVDHFGTNKLKVVNIERGGKFTEIEFISERMKVTKRTNAWQVFDWVKREVHDFTASQIA